MYDSKNDEIDRIARRVQEQKGQKALARAAKPKEKKGQCIQIVTSVAAPINSSAPLQQIPPSPPHKEEPEQQVSPEVIVPVPTAQEEQNDVVDIFHNNPCEEYAPPQQQENNDHADEDIEVEKPNPSPPELILVDPSTSSEKDDKIEGEQSAPREKPNPVTPSAVSSLMDVDSAPCP